MNQQEFASVWTEAGEPLEKFDDAVIDKLVVSEQTKSWLRVGLPAEAPPAFNLGPGAGAFLQPVAEEFSLPEEFAQFRVIGFTIYDDPICLDEGTEEIVLFDLNEDVDEEEEEEEFGAIYLNKTVTEFASFLAMFNRFAERIENVTGDDRDEIIASTVAAMRKLDEEAMEDGSFWVGEVEAYSEEETCFEEDEE